MIRLPLSMALVISLAGCATPPQPAPGYLPADTFGDTVQGQDPTAAATGAAEEVFAHPAQVQGNPAAVAIAVASVDALAGQFAASGRFITTDATQQLENARDRLRQILGISETAPSQSVIDPLVAAAHALQRGDRSAALADLAGSVFTRPPAQTLAILSKFPYVPAADAAIEAASAAEYPQDGGGMNDF